MPPMTRSICDSTILHGDRGALSDVRGGGGNVLMKSFIVSGAVRASLWPIRRELEAVHEIVMIRGT